MSDPIIIPAAPGFRNEDGHPVAAWKIIDVNGNLIAWPIAAAWSAAYDPDWTAQKDRDKKRFKAVMQAQAAKTASTAPPAPTVASTPPAPRPAPVAPTPAGAWAVVVATGMHGPTASSGQQYLNVTVQHEERKLMLRFYWNSATQDAEWKTLFAQFCLMCGVERFEDTDELLGHRVAVQFPESEHTRSLSGLDSIRAALGLEASGD